MEAKIFISDKIVKGETLKDVMRQFKSYESPTSVFVDINSIGGNVDEGEDIYTYLKGLSATLPVTTYAQKAYSIAAKIHAAGSVRLVDDNPKVMMIHFPWVGPIEGNADKLEAYSEYLRGIEKEFVNFYSDFIATDKDTVKSLLDNETFLSGEEAISLGFATGFKEAIEAMAEFNINLKTNKQMTDKKKGIGKRFLAAMAAFVESVDGASAELKLQDSTGTEIVFPDVEEGELPQVGSVGTIDGSPVPDGRYIIPSMESQVLVFVGGSVSEILPKEEENPEGAQARLSGPAKAEEVQQISVWTTEVVNTSFAEGDIVKYKDWEGVEKTIGSGEFQLSDGRRVVTDATGVIVKIKESTNQAGATIEPEASFEEMISKVTSKVTANIEASFNQRLAKKDEEISELKKLIGSKEVKAELKEQGGGVEGKSQVSILLTRRKKQ